MCEVCSRNQIKKSSGDIWDIVSPEQTDYYCSGNNYKNNGKFCLYPTNWQSNFPLCNLLLTFFLT